jgi:hypothetical protein
MSFFRTSILLSTIACLTVIVHADDNESIRVAAKPNNNAKSKVPHPLDPAIEIAYQGLDRMKEIEDYTAQLIRRERTNGKLSPFEYSTVKIRNARPAEKIPFSIYMGFTKPRSINGREAIWIEGKNSDKIVAHEAGMILGKITVFLNPNGPIAMRGNRYPMYEAGFQVLVNRLIEKAERERQYQECEVNIVEDKMVNKRPCKMIEVMHPQEREYFDFHIARIYIDNEMQLPIRYEAYDWAEDGGEPVLLEQYLYTKIKLNVGLTDEDFNPRSEKYNFCFATPPKTDPDPERVAEKE